MARQKRVISWYPARKCWRKKKRINGKQRAWYFQYPKNEEGYTAALAQWQKIEQRLGAKTTPDERSLETVQSPMIEDRSVTLKCLTLEDSDLVPKSQVGFHQKIVESKKWLNPLSSPHQVVALSTQFLFGAADRYGEQRLLFPRRPIDYPQDFGENSEGSAEYFEEGLSKRTCKHHLVGYNAEEYIERRLKEVPDQLAPGTWNVISRDVRLFADWFGRDKDVDEITSKVLLDYHDHLVSQTNEPQKKRKFGRRTANGRLKNIKSFIRWLCEMEIKESLPRNIDSRSLRIEFDIPKIVLFEKGEVLNLINGSSDQMQLYLLLALNCAMLPKDISDLRPDEVNWEEGRIVRSRSKTRRRKARSNNIPTVNYLLWPETFELLKRFRTDSADHVLLNRNGAPLKTSFIGDDKKIHNISNIARQYGRLQDKLKIPKESRKSFKTFRATGASKLAEHETFGRYAQYYLADAPRSIADKHYVVPPKAQFDKAITWLGEQFSLTR
jgi:integrase